jgi:paraquat-inducible protein B
VKRLNSDVVPPLTTTLQHASQFSNDLNTELTPQLGDVLRELQGAARAIRILSDYLEQHPDALIKGKK